MNNNRLFQLMILIIGIIGIVSSKRCPPQNPINEKKIQKCASKLVKKLNKQGLVRDYNKNYSYAQNLCKDVSFCSKWILSDDKYCNGFHKCKSLCLDEYKKAVKNDKKPAKDNGITKSGLDPKNFVSEYNGMPTALYTLTNSNGMEVCITNFGGRIVSIMVPDKDGNFKDVVLGFEKISDYFPENNQSDFGAAIGRYANRIVGGTFELDGTLYTLPTNNGNSTLHGGPTGWQYQVYEVVEADKHHIKLFRDSPDGDNNFPGNVKAYVTYTLTEKNAIEINYEATTDKPTVINMTNHSYFNIDGNPAGDILDDILYINANSTTEVVEGNLPTGNIVSLLGTPLDFTTPKRIGDDIGKTEYEPIAIGNGYDHNFILNTMGNIKEPAAILTSPKTGIKLSVFTDEPGFIVYTANWLYTENGKHGITYNKRAGVCLESGHYPDSPNFPNFPSVVLRPGEKFTSNCIYSFSVEK